VRLATRLFECTRIGIHIGGKGGSAEWNGNEKAAKLHSHSIECISDVHNCISIDLVFEGGLDFNLGAGMALPNLYSFSLVGLALWTVGSGLFL
jgi:hypothetical protein